LKTEPHQPLGGGLVLHDYPPSNSSDVGEQQQQMEELQEQRGEQQLTEQQLIEEQYRQTLAEQQEQQRLLDEPISDELMPHQGEDEQLLEEHQRKAVSNCRDLSDAEMVSAAKVDSSVAMTIMPDNGSLVEKTESLVTPPCEEQAVSMV